MAMAIQPGENFRFTDICDEPMNYRLLPIEGYEDKPLVALTEANCQNPVDGLTQDESASIHLYTMQFLSGPSLYLLLNQLLRAENREELKPWFSFFKLFFTALHKLPSQSGTVWRGVRDVDLSSKYKTGTRFAWWGVSSCATHMKVLESNTFLGKHGERTLFSIECINGKSIATHSYLKNKETEIILMPDSFFEVIGQVNPTPDLHIIQLKEITPPVTLVKLPFSKSTSLNHPSTSNTSNVYSQDTSKMIKQSASSKIFSKDTKWKQYGITVAAGNGDGNRLNQLFSSFSICIDDDQSIYIVDSGNNRIVKWKSNATNGRIVAGGNGQGYQTNQLNGPTDVIIDKENNDFIIADCGNRRVMRWSRQNNTNGQIIISDIDYWGLAMDKDGHFYVSDWKQNEVRRWKRGEKNGTIVPGGNGKGDHIDQLNYPTFIFVDEDHSLYVSDMTNHRVLCWCKGTKEGTIVVGGNGEGQQSNQFNSPRSLSFDRQGNLYVVDCYNNRIQKFEINENKNNLVHLIEL